MSTLSERLRTELTELGAALVGYADLRADRDVAALTLALDIGDISDMDER